MEKKIENARYSGKGRQSLYIIYKRNEHVLLEVVFMLRIPPVQNCPLVPCACADGSGMNFCTITTVEATPLIALSVPWRFVACSLSYLSVVR